MNKESPSYQENLKKPTLVLGATGFVGSNIVRQLVAANRNVRVLVRNSSNTAAIDDLNVERHIGDVMDVESLKKAMRGCGTVFHSVVDARAWLTDPSPLYRCNVEGLVNSMEAALAEGISRFVFTSSMATIGINKKGPASENDAFNWWDKAPHYIRSRVEAENKMLEYCRDKGLPGVAMCVANTYGPRDVQPTPHGGALQAAALGKLPIALDCSAPTVDIRDAAEAALLAERYGRVGERYIVANDYASQVEMYAIAAAVTGQKPPRTLSYKRALFMATVSEFIAKLRGQKDFRFSRDTVFLSEVFGPMDNSKIKKELGWKPRPIEQTVKDAIEWYTTHQRKSA